MASVSKGVSVFAIDSPKAFFFVILMVYSLVFSSRYSSEGIISRTLFE